MLNNKKADPHHVRPALSYCVDTLYERFRFSAKYKGFADHLKTLAKGDDTEKLIGESKGE